VLVVSVSGGGIFIVASSELLHDGVSDAFPCDGQNMHCLTDHAGSVAVHGPASVNTVAPLVCAGQSADSCLSGYVDMPSCLADIATGMTSCFVYLQADARGLGTVTAATGRSFEVHGGGQPLLAIEADWEVVAAASLVLADLQLLGGRGGALAMHSTGDVTLLRVAISSGTIAFSSSLAVTECALTSTELTGSTASPLLSLSGGMLTGSTVSLSAGSAVLGGSCTLVNSPVSVTAGTVSVSACELQSDGSIVPLTIETGGSAVVTGGVFRSSVGDVTAVSVAAGGSLTVGASQLVGVDGSSAPFPCDGTLPDCAGAHVGSVDVAGPVAVTLASPLVCDVGTGECLSDMCFVVDCGDRGTCVSPLGTCDWCDPNPCLHSGTCVLDGSQEGYHCECVSRFTSAQEWVSAQPPNVAAYKGTVRMGQNEMWRGDHCEQFPCCSTCSGGRLGQWCACDQKTCNGECDGDPCYNGPNREARCYEFVRQHRSNGGWSPQDAAALPLGCEEPATACDESC